MTRVQRYCKDLANQGIECTPDEVRGLVKVAKKIKELSFFPKNELMGIFDLKNRQHKAIFDMIMKLKKD